MQYNIEANSSHVVTPPSHRIDFYCTLFASLVQFRTLLGTDLPHADAVLVRPGRGQHDNCDNSSTVARPPPEHSQWGKATSQVNYTHATHWRPSITQFAYMLSKGVPPSDKLRTRHAQACLQYTIYMHAEQRRASSTKIKMTDVFH